MEIKMNIRAAENEAAAEFGYGLDVCDVGEREREAKNIPRSAGELSRLHENFKKAVKYKTHFSKLNVNK